VDDRIPVAAVTARHWRRSHTLVAVRIDEHGDGVASQARPFAYEHTSVEGQPPRVGVDLR
jgi:hypothetical protein